MESKPESTINVDTAAKSFLREIVQKAIDEDFFLLEASIQIKILPQAIVLIGVFLLMLARTF